MRDKMFRTRQEVDKHVNNSLKKINNETERNLRCFSFAKLYLNVGDYDHAVRYITSYLSVKPKSPEGHNLLGQALEKLGKKQAALEAYRTSLQLDPKQNSLIIKVCELMAEDDVDIDNSGARYFCDLAESQDPQNPIITNLKEKLIINDSKDPMEVSQFLLKELENRPTDVNLRVRLLTHFLENNMLKEAYKHAYDIEQKKLGIFDNSFAWYETFAKVLVRYQRDASISTQLTWEFWFLSASVLERLAALTLSDHLETMKSTTDYVLAVFNFDQSFLKASQYVNLCPDKALLKEFLNHYEAQLCFHFSVLALKQAKKDLMTFKEVKNLILPLLFIAYQVPLPDTRAVWFNNLPENRRLLVAGWHKEASFRCSQAGNILVGLAKDRRNILLEKANQYSTGMWREQLFKKLFVKRDQQLKSSTSFFVSSSLEPVIQLPDYRDLITHNEVAQTVHPDSLHHYIWLALNYQNLSDFTLKSFDGLQYTVKNMSNCGAETLNVLDVQSFIYCATLCAQSKIKNADSGLTYFNQDRPSVLPVSITGNLGTVNQTKFLLAAYKMYKHDYAANMGEIRMVLIKGIEVIRCVGNHGLDVKLLVTLASLFTDKIKNFTKQSEIEANSARAELYWKTALPLLEKLKNEHALIYPKQRLFEYQSNKSLSREEIDGYIEKAKLFIGTQLMKKKEYEKAMHIFEGLKDPYASFYQSQIYKLMADSKTNLNKENVTSEMRSQNIILLSRARDCLYLTLDRLREPCQDRDHPLNAQLGTEIEKTERLLSRIDPDCANRNECDGMSDENVSDDSTGEHFLSTYTHHASFHNGRDLSGKHDTLNIHSTPLRLGVPRQEARPSPERLDAQLRQLMASRDVAMNSVMEQNKMMVELQRSLTDEIRGFKDAVKNLTSAVDERARMFTGNFEDVKKMMDDLTHSVDDRLQSVTDMVQEMRRELNDIKKDQTKNAQLSVEDLYDLDPDYNSPLDYNLGNNLGNTQPNLNSMVNNFYPNYHRLAPGTAANLAAYGGQGLYPGLYPGLPYPYGPLGLAQPGALPFLQSATADQQQLTHLPNIPSLTQPVYPAANANQSHLGTQAQTIPAPSKEVPKTVFSSQTGFGISPVSQTPQGLLQVKDSPKPSVSSANASSSFGPSGFLGQNLSISSPVVAPGSANVTSAKAPPVNVVITSSDPLPTFKTTIAQPVLSVTIPPQHIKGNVIPKPIPASQPPPFLSQVHNYQIPLPPTNSVTTAPSILSQPPPLVSTQSLLSNIPSPAISAIAKNQSPAKDVSLGIQIEKVLDKTFPSPNKSNSSLNKSNISTTSVDEYDPRPDFQPIIPLPDEVPVTTGEEKETELFCQRAKLFRLALVNGTREWKERGVGNIKILSNPETGKVRLIMRREQVHKICANHFLTNETVLSPMANNDRAYIWAAHDYADEKIVVEKFCARFKTAEEAKKFADAFNVAKTKIIEHQPPADVLEVDKDATPSTLKIEESAQTTPSNLGGFKFISTPTFKPKEELKPTPKVEEVKEPAQPSPFAAFSFGAKATGTPSKSLFENLALESPKFSPFVAPSQNISKETSLQKDENTEEIKTGAKKEELSFSFSVKSTPNSQTEVTITPVTAGWGGQFKPTMGSWECTTCYVTNSADKSKCVSCETLKDGSTVVASTDSSLKGISLDTGGQKFNFGIPAPSIKPDAAVSITPINQKQEPVQKFSFSVPPPTIKSDPSSVLSGFGDSFKPKAGTWECKACYIRNEPSSVYCLSCETPKDDSVPKKESTPKGINLETPGLKFSFGMPVVSSAPTTTSTFAFGDTVNTKAAFSWKPAETTITEAVATNNTTKNEEKFVFGSPQKHEFEFKPRSPRRISTGQGDESDASYVEEEETHIYFKPVIPLPDIVDVKTGEENEEVLYSHRTKLYRFVAGEWKERGLGEVKILKDNSTKKLRVVMRREQVLKICLNHWLTKEIEYLPKDEKTWLFHAADFSEGTLSRDQFCLRFKNSEVAREFKKTADDALSSVEIHEVSSEGEQINVKKPDIDLEVEFVSETQVTPEEEQEAIRLGLPPKFMAYRQRPDCVCEQCKKDDEYLKELFNKEAPVKAVLRVSSTNTSSLFGTPTANTSTPSSTGSVFASPAAASFTFGTPTSDTSTITRLNSPKPETLRDLLQKTSVAQGTTTPKTIGDMLKNESATPASASLVLATNTPKSPGDKGSIASQSVPNFSFGGPLQKSTSGSASLFGSNSNIFKTGASFNIFRTPKEATNGNIFESKPVLTPSDSGSKSPFAATGNLFVSDVTTPTTAPLFQNPNNLFGSASSKSSNNSIFGSATTGSAGNIFGGGASTPSAVNLFGTTSQANIFSNAVKPAATGNIFGQTIFGNKAEPKVTDANLTFGTTTTSNLKETDEAVLKGDSNLSFANLAAQVGSKPVSTTFGDTTKSDEKTAFAFLGAGAPVFGNGATSKQENKTPSKDQLNKTQEGSDKEEESVDHDPHFEPVVPLPDQIVVSTGEEEETVVFNERAKLFRYDSNTKEWKERGIGQFKILFHPENKTYRLLLRREQVHKVVLNQRITPDLELQAMTTSDKAWIWAGMNYSEDEAKLEQLAVRFKSSELAQAFKNCMEETVKKVTEIQANKSLLNENLPTAVRDFGIEDVNNEEIRNYDDEHDYQEDDEEEEDEEDEDDDDDDRTIMFTKRCTLSEEINGDWQQVCMGELQVYYDPELYVARICIINDSGETVSNTMIGLNTIMEIQGKECWWKAIDWANAHENPKWRTLKAIFSSIAAAQEFHSNYLEGINYAQEVGAIDALAVDNELEHD